MKNILPVYMDSSLDIGGFRDKIPKIHKPPFERKWYTCPNCGKNVALYDNTAHCAGVYMKCKECSREFEKRI